MTLTDRTLRACLKIYISGNHSANDPKTMNKDILSNAVDVFWSETVDTIKLKKITSKMWLIHFGCNLVRNFRRIGFRILSSDDMAM